MAYYLAMQREPGYWLDSWLNHVERIAARTVAGFQRVPFWREAADYWIGKLSSLAGTVSAPFRESDTLRDIIVSVEGRLPNFRTRHCAIALAVVTSSGALAYLARDRVYHHILDEWCTRYPPPTLRSDFLRLPLPLVNEDRSHTHPKSAAERNLAVIFASTLAAMSGMTTWNYQRSAADVRWDRLGSTTYYWVKDLSAGYTPDLSPDRLFRDYGHVLKILVDVDYYLDMRRTLLEARGSILMYTLVPGAVAADRGEYAFTFDAQNQVHYTVSGGAKYTHQLWNYGTDSLSVSGWVWNSWLPKYVTNAFLVERRSVGPDHAIVLLSLQRRWTGFAALLASYLQGGQLNRLTVNHGGTLSLDIMTQEGLMRSRGNVNKYLSSVTPACDDDAVELLGSLSTVKLPIASVQSFVHDRAQAAVMTHYHRESTGEVPDVVYRPEEGRHRYQVGGRHFDGDAKPSMTAYCSPIVPTAFVPDHTLANDEAMIEGRVISVKSDVNASEKLTFIMKEFVEHLVPQHMGILADLDEVWDKQDRPSQRRIFESGTDGRHPDDRIRSFQKSEAYDEPKPPRNISTIDAVRKIAYSRVIYPLADVLKCHPWYAFGRTPADIAERMAAIAMASETILTTDLSRFDGRVSEVLRQLERMILARFFRPEYHTAVFEAHRSQYNVIGVTSFGVRYDSGTSRASGSPETSAFNTVANAFMAFVALRTEKRGGAFETAEQAFEHLATRALFGGDDGVLGNVSADAYESSCLTVGQVAKVATYNRGDNFVNFLDRYYGDGLWNGDPVSCCNIVRQVSKLHVCSGPVQFPGLYTHPTLPTPAQKLRDKLTAYFLTDRNTPVFNLLVEALIRIDGTPSTDGIMTKDTSWFAQYASTVQFPNEARDWMFLLLEQQLPTFDYGKLVVACAKARTMDDLLRLPVCVIPDIGQSQTSTVDAGFLAVPVSREGPPMDYTKAGHNSQPAGQLANPDGKTQAFKKKQGGGGLSAKQKRTKKGKMEAGPNVPKARPGMPTGASGSSDQNPSGST